MLYHTPARRFLGPDGAATVLLLKSSGPALLPPLKEFQRLLESDEIKIYKGDGWYTREISYLERVLQIVKGASMPLPWNSVSTTEFLLLPPGRSRSDKDSLFFQISCASVLVEGFDLTESRMQDLAGYIETHSEILEWQNTVSNYYNSLHRQAKRAYDRNLQDQTLICPDIAALQQIMAGYGDSALTDVTTEIDRWYSAYKW